MTRERSTPRREHFQPNINHWTMKIGLFKERLTKAQVQHVLLELPSPIIQGRGCEWKSKHVGAGIYELWAEEKA